MNHLSLQKQLEASQDRYGLRAVSYLSAAAIDLPHDVSERLRAARVQAVAQRKVVQNELASGVVRSGSGAALNWGSGEGFGWLGRIGSVVPILALLAGLLAINAIHSDGRVQELAEVDAALLIDELPPAAFADPGFVQFLKNSN